MNTVFAPIAKPWHQMDRADHIEDARRAVERYKAEVAEQRRRFEEDLRKSHEAFPAEMEAAEFALVRAGVPREFSRAALAVIVSGEVPGFRCTLDDQL